MAADWPQRLARRPERARRPARRQPEEAAQPRRALGRLRTRARAGKQSSDEGQKHMGPRSSWLMGGFLGHESVVPAALMTGAPTASRRAASAPSTCASGAAAPTIRGMGPASTQKAADARQGGAGDRSISPPLKLQRADFHKLWGGVAKKAALCVFIEAFLWCPAQRETRIDLPHVGCAVDATC